MRWDGPLCEDRWEGSRQDVKAFRRLGRWDGVLWEARGKRVRVPCHRRLRCLGGGSWEVACGGSRWGTWCFAEGFFEDGDERRAGLCIGPSHARHHRENGVEVFDIKGEFCARLLLIEVEVTPREESALIVLQHDSVTVRAADHGARFIDGASAIFEQWAEIVLFFLVNCEAVTEALLCAWFESAYGILEGLGFDLEECIGGATTRETPFSATDLFAIEGVLTRTEFCDLGEECAVFVLDIVLQGERPLCGQGAEQVGGLGQKSREGKKAHGQDPEAVASSEKGWKVCRIFEKVA